jgi:hypothetical protein
VIHDSGGRVQMMVFVALGSEHTRFNQHRVPTIGTRSCNVRIRIVSNSCVTKGMKGKLVYMFCFFRKQIRGKGLIRTINSAFEWLPVRRDWQWCDLVQNGLGISVGARHWLPESGELEVLARQVLNVVPISLFVSNPCMSSINFVRK